MSKSRMERELPLSAGDPKIDAAIKAAMEEPISTRPVETDYEGLYLAGLKEGLYIDIRFDVVADEEVKIVNPLDHVPDICHLVSLPNRAAIVYRSDPDLNEGDTWDEDHLGFKCNVDTSTDALVVRIYVE